MIFRCSNCSTSLTGFFWYYRGTNLLEVYLSSWTFSSRHWLQGWRQMLSKLSIFMCVSFKRIKVLLILFLNDKLIEAAYIESAKVSFAR